MKCIKLKIGLSLVSLLLSISTWSQEDEATEILNDVIDWQVSKLMTTASEHVKISGHPKLIDSPYGQAVYFDGIDSALFYDKAVLKNASSFTVEMIFNPDKTGEFEQRVLHIGEVSGDRMLLEIRALDEEWYFDGFVKSGSHKRALIDETLTHPFGNWYHVAFVVTPNTLTTFVNGKQELTEAFTFKPIQTGRTSIGVRLNERSWFKGSIYRIKITPTIITPNQFITYK
ncbi:LamG-like jellyroll fold domain-containing protein [Formosa sp. 4Alg 33]|uniref:LamG-like jellyroll fold domain-containing protein n=1 Tax=Formosa sp. 4Alg 33 TaxID=3382189 RepID=UPI003D9C526F